MNIKAIIFALFILSGLSFSSSAATFSGSNVPYDSSLHLGVVSGPGTGIDIGADFFIPISWCSVGAELEQQVTNSEFDQNINITKYGLALKYSISDELFLTFHLGRSSFYLTKTINYIDSFSGEEFTIDENSYGSATYLAFAPNFIFSDYIVTPKAAVNNIAEGGSLFEFDLNVGHRF